MKSAYELAIERAGVKSVQKLTDEQKQKITKIDSFYKSKRAEAELSGKERIMKAGGNIEEIDQIKRDLSVELASIRSKQEREKEKIRNNE